MATGRGSNQLIRQFKFSDLWTTRRGSLIAFLGVFVVVGVTLLIRTYAAGGVTLFNGSAVPKTADSGDAQAVELGFKFKSDVPGTVTGVRFYKSAANTGTHLGNLWSSTGTRLATVTFSGETSSGWQQASFSAPVSITPGTTYIVSYHTNSGHYADDTGGFTRSIDSAPLHALADGASGPNGVYAYGTTSAFPTSGWQSSNYWVDVVFDPATSPSPTPTPVATPSPATALSVDQQVVAHPATKANTVTSPALSTAGGNELLEAFIMTDGPNTTKSVSVTSVTGGGLTWSLRTRSNTQAGTSEIWQAVAPSTLTNVTVTATLSGSYTSSMVVVAFKGADTTTNGAVAAASATSGAPSVSLTTTRGGSWVWATGNDWDNATARTLSTGQTLVDQYLAPVGDTYWVQRGSGATPVAPTTVTMSDTAPTTDRWNLTAVEVLPAVAPPTPSPTATPAPTPSTSPSPTPTPAPDTTPPTAPTNLTGNGTSSTQISLSWGTSTDNVGVVAYDVYRNGAKVGSATATTFSDTALTPSTAYSYYVKARDAAGNASAASGTVTISTQAAPDTTAPSTPTGLQASAVSPTQVNLTWTASTDNVGVTSYLVLRTNVVVATVTGATYSDTAAVANTTYSYKVEAKDAAGNVSAPSTAANVTTPNPPDTQAPTVPTGLTATAASSTQVNLSWTASTDNVAVAGYNIYRGGTKIATSTTTSFGDGTVAAGATYSYTVSAYDGAGNASAQSGAVSVTTPGGPTPPPTVGLCTSGYSNWSDPATWGGSVPAAGSSPTIPAGAKVKLDVDAPHLNTLTVNGELCFPDRATTFSAKAIAVYGKLSLGTATTPLTQAVMIKLEGGSTDPTVDSYAVSGQAASDIAAYNQAHANDCAPATGACISLGAKFGTNVLTSLNGGTIEIYGADRGLMWTKLAATASAGSGTLTLQDPVSWKPGDKLAIASSTLDPFQAETATVASVSADGKTVTLTAALANKHAGLSTCYTNAGQTRCVDERSEVGLLTQNIKITGPDNTPTTGFGGHTIVLPGGSMRIKNAEMYNLGQLGVLGRYPLHFHILGNSGSNSSVTNVSLHDNQNRALTIHGSNNLTASGMVSYKTIGHSVMLEDGFEEGNTLDHNLVMGTTFNSNAAQRLRFSDIVPSDFWITNPKNTLNGNAAAGGEGAGFWYDFENQSDNTHTAAAFLPITGFNNNVAHSHLARCNPGMGEAVSPVGCSQGQLVAGTGITFDNYIGDPDLPRPVLTGNSSWMNKSFGIWNDGILTYKDGTAANNEIAFNLQDTSAQGGLYLGSTANSTAGSDYDGLVRFYHGSGDVDGSWMGNFDSGTAFTDSAASTGDYTPRIRGIVFFSNKHAGSTAFFSDSYRVAYGRPYLDTGIPSYPYINHDHWIADLDGSIKNGSIGPGFLSDFSGLLVPAAGQPADQTLYTNTPGIYDSNFGSYGTLVQNGFDRSKVVRIRLDDEFTPKRVTRNDSSTPSYGGIGAFAMGHAYKIQSVSGGDVGSSFRFSWSTSEPGNFELYWHRPAGKPTSVRSGYNADGPSYTEVACGSTNKNNTWCYDSATQTFHAFLQVNGTPVPFGQAGNFNSLDYGGGVGGNVIWNVK